MISTEEAIELIEKEEKMVPPKNIIETYLKIAEDKKRLKEIELS